MKKLLHESLRYIACEKEDSLYSGDIIKALCEEFGVCEHNSSYAIDLNNCLKAIADEIEKYYIPRPRFEDGEPVQFGDEVELHYKYGGREKGRIQAWHVNKGPVWELSFVGVDHERLYRYDSEVDVLKRPVPKVLDADGTEIKVGDTVWGKYSGVEHEVIGFDSCDGLLCVSIRNVETGSTGGASPNLLTHREPDSLEKLLVDLRGAADFIPSKEYLKHLADRLTAIMERDA